MNIHKLFNEWNKVTDTIHFSKEQIAQLIHLIKLVMLDEYESFYIPKIRKQSQWQSQLQ